MSEARGSRESAYPPHWSLTSQVHRVARYTIEPRATDPRATDPRATDPGGRLPTDEILKNW